MKTAQTSAHASLATSSLAASSVARRPRAPLVIPALALLLSASACTAPNSSDDTNVDRGTGGASATGGKSGGASGGSTGSNPSPGSSGGATGSSGGATGSSGGATGSSGGATGSSGGASGSAGSGGSATDSGGGTESDAGQPPNTAPPGGGGGAAEPPESTTPPTTDLTKHRFSRVITIGNAGITGDVKDFPVAVLLTGTNFDFAQAKPLGEDVRFSTMDGTLLPYSIEQWDPAAKKAALWVRMDVKAAGQTFLMHFGNPDAQSAARSKAVFSTAAGFLGVYHLNQDGNVMPDGYPDHSENGANGTGIKLAAGSLMEGRIGAGTHLKNPGGGGAEVQWIKVDGPKVMDDFNGNAKHPISATIWALADSFGGYYETIFSKGDTSWSLQRDYQGRIEACTRVPGYHACAITAKPTTKVWVHYMVVQKPGNLTLYVNGKRAAGAGGTSQYGPHAFGIGNQTQYNIGPGWKRGWDGILDEARVMTGERSPDWAKLDFENQKPGSTLLTVGPATMK
jgi:hypothetical protein